MITKIQCDVIGDILLFSILQKFLPVFMTLIGACMAFGGFHMASILHKERFPAGYVRTPAYIQETPEIGIGIQKVPIILPLPTLIFRKAKHLIAKPVSMPLCVGCASGSIPYPPAYPPVAVPYPNVQFPNEQYQTQNYAGGRY